MRIQLKTPVSGNYLDVMQRFDRQLFEFLTPKQAGVEILEFTGSETGDTFHLRFYRPVKAEWIGRIIDHGAGEQEAFFTDEGEKLPFPLAYWKHKHIVRKVEDDRSLIIDDIRFKGVNFLWTLLLYPLIYAGFYPRKKGYKKYFGE